MISFGLTNAPIAIVKFMNDVFREQHDKCVIAYLTWFILGVVKSMLSIC